MNIKNLFFLSLITTQLVAMDQPLHSSAGWLTRIVSRCAAFIRSDIQSRADRVGFISEERSEAVVADPGAEDICQNLIRRLSDRGLYGEAGVYEDQRVVHVYKDATKRKKISIVLVARVNSL